MPGKRSSNEDGMSPIACLSMLRTRAPSPGRSSIRPHAPAARLRLKEQPMSNSSARRLAFPVLRVRMSCLVIGIAGILQPISAFGGDLIDCMQPNDMPRVIAGCTGLLEANTTHPHVAMVYWRRSMPTQALGDFERDNSSSRSARRRCDSEILELSDRTCHLKLSNHSVPQQEAIT